MIDAYLSIEINQLRSKLLDLADVQYFSPTLRIFQEKLQLLIDRLLDQTETQVSSIDKERLWEYVEFLKESVVYLEDSTLNVTPYETVFCLQKVLEEWVDEVPVIVTSTKTSNYHFKGALSDLGNLSSMIIEDFNIEFDEELVQIGIPQLEVYNYLYNMVIYHEVGHFIDQYYNISETVATEIYHIKGDKTKGEQETLNHYMEHFCDLFAAQYVGKLINDYLEATAQNFTDSESHPSTESRIVVVNDFLQGNTNTIVDTLSLAVERQAEGHKLKVRYHVPEVSAFESFIPIIITSEPELHGIYQTAWTVWKNRKTIYPKLTDSQSFEVVNNLTGKTIANYMIREKWKS